MTMPTRACGKFVQAYSPRTACQISGNGFARWPESVSLTSVFNGAVSLNSALELKFSRTGT